MTGLQRMGKGREVQLILASKPLEMHHPEEGGASMGAPTLKQNSNRNAYTCSFGSSSAAVPAPRKPKPSAQWEDPPKRHWSYHQNSQHHQLPTPQQLQAYLGQLGLWQHASERNVNMDKKYIWEKDSKTLLWSFHLKVIFLVVIAF